MGWITLDLSSRDGTAEERSFTGYITTASADSTTARCGKEAGSGKTNGYAFSSASPEGATFVLADTAGRTVYRLDDQTRVRAFAGEKVTIRGALEGDTIHVKRICSDT